MPTLYEETTEMTRAARGRFVQQPTYWRKDRMPSNIQRVLARNVVIYSGACGGGFEENSVYA